MVKFKEYQELMVDNDIYYLATILDPRIKIQWIKDNIEDVEKIIDRIRTFLKVIYPPEPELSPNEENDIYKNLEYRFMAPYYIDITTDDFDIDRYLDSPRIKYKNKL